MQISNFVMIFFTLSFKAVSGLRTKTFGLISYLFSFVLSAAFYNLCLNSYSVTFNVHILDTGIGRS